MPHNCSKQKNSFQQIDNSRDAVIPKLHHLIVRQFAFSNRYDKMTSMLPISKLASNLWILNEKKM